MKNTLLFAGAACAPFAVIILVPIAVFAAAVCSIIGFWNLVVAGINNESSVSFA
jgi:hypothetical protein